MNLSHQNSQLSDDEALVLRIQRGDKEAFTKFYTLHGSTMYLAAYHLLRNEDDARDAVQELFLYVWEKADRIDPKGNIKGFLYTILRNRILTLMSRSKYFDEYVSSCLAFGQQGASHTEETVLARELEQVLQNRINQLPSRMRDVYELAWRDNLNNKEIAALLDITEGTVKQQKHNALRILREKLRNLLSLFF